MIKKWKYTQDEIILKYTESLARELDVSVPFAKILLRRMYKRYPDIFDSGDKGKLLSLVNFFLNPSLQRLLFPQFLPDMEEACEYVVQSIRKKEKILVWGDYDADGITATACCIEFFQKHGYEILSHIPQRKEGYGINKSALEEYIKQDVKLLISVDCGISDAESIAFAKEQGMTVIVTDHHTPAQTLPPADAIINPHLCEESSLFFKQDIALAGVGVAFFFLCHLNTKLFELSGYKCDMREFLDLVALGTIADMVPLIGQNRILVKNGLLMIAQSSRLSLQALKEVSGYAKQAKLSAGQIAFGLAPRINAAGRMDNPRLALDFLLCKNFDQALTLAKKLDAWNAKRKQEEERAVIEACEQAEKYKDEPSLVLENISWNQGIVGIVASRMIERYNKPTFILTQDGQEGYLKGSGRSIPEVDLNAALNVCSNCLYQFGGHKYAAGIKIENGMVELFRKAFNDFVKEIVGEEPCQPSLSIEDRMDFGQASDFFFLKELEMLEPFGLGNAEPVFSSDSITLKNVIPFGYDKKHLKLELYDSLSGQTLSAKLWNTKELEYNISSLLSLAYTIERDSYNGLSHVNVKVKDIKPH